MCPVGAQQGLRFQLSTAAVLQGRPLLVLANKQDLPGAAQPAEVAQALGLTRKISGRQYAIRECCALHGQGVQVSVMDEPG